MELVAVYCGLRKECGGCFFTDKEYIGEGRTSRRYRMVVTSIPYLLKGMNQGRLVVVEVYHITKEKLKKLDDMYGHPKWFQRQKIEIKLQKDYRSFSKKNVFAWVYFSHNEKLDRGRYFSDLVIALLTKNVRERK